MLDKERFDLIKQKFGYLASWAIWAEQSSTPKSNVGDLSIFEQLDLQEKLSPQYVLVGLNISRGSIKNEFGNFHDARSEATDYKIRYALKDTCLWGSYMTDILKDFNQKDSGKVMVYLRNNPEFERQNVEYFSQEIKELGVESPTLVAFGNDVFSILKRNFDYRIFKIPHYASYMSKEKYRETVLTTCKAIEVAQSN